MQGFDFTSFAPTNLDAAGDRAAHQLFGPYLSPKKLFFGPFVSRTFSLPKRDESQCATEFL